MKNKIKITTLLALNLGIFYLSYSQNNIEFSGKVMDEFNNPLPYAHISLKNKAQGTVANEDGDFVFKGTNLDKKDTLVISHLGYYPHYQNVFTIQSKLIFQLNKQEFDISEAIIRPLVAREIVQKSIALNDSNYYRQPRNHKAFYRETIQENGKFFEYAEGILDLYKEPGESYLIKLLKGRRQREIEQFESSKSTRITIGGPRSCLYRDVISYKWSFIQNESLHNYNYEIDDVTSYNGNSVYVIKFDRMPKNKKALYAGELYIDMKTFTLIKVNFRFNDYGMKKEQPGPLVNGIAKMLRTEIEFGNSEASVSYAELNNKWTLKDINYEFYIQMKRKKVDYKYVTQKYLTIISSDLDNPIKFKEEELLISNEEFGEQVGDYDENFWENYNYMKPSESLNKLLNNTITGRTQ